MILMEKESWMEVARHLRVFEYENSACGRENEESGIRPRSKTVSMTLLALKVDSPVSLLTSVREASDTYAFGAMLFLLLMGKQPRAFMLHDGSLMKGPRDVRAVGLPAHITQEPAYANGGTWA
jgi:hypothetical protein